MAIELGEKVSDGVNAGVRATSAEQVFSTNRIQITNIKDAFSLKFRTGHFAADKNPTGTNLTYLQKEDGVIFVVSETVTDSGERKRGKVVTKISRETRAIRTVEANMQNGFKLNLLINGEGVAISSCCSLSELATVLNNQGIETGEMKVLESRATDTYRKVVVEKTGDDQLLNRLSLEG
jgi:hypothetical protein